MKPTSGHVSAEGQARIREQMFTKSRKRAHRKIPTRTAKVPAWYIRPDGSKP